MVAESSGVRSEAYKCLAAHFGERSSGFVSLIRRGARRTVGGRGVCGGSFCLFFDHTTSAVVCAHAAHDTCAVHHAYLHRIVYPLE